MLKLDFSNAFNSVHRDDILLAVHESVPEIYNLCHLCYSQSSTLQFGQFVIWSSEGPSTRFSSFLFSYTPIARTSQIAFGVELY